MIKLGGGSFTPGAVETVSSSSLDATESTATLKLETIEVAGSLTGSTWSFSFTADQSGALKPYTRYNPQIVYGSGESEEVRLETGARKEATTATVAPSATVVAEIAGGAGITTSPASGITDKGSVAVDTTWLATQIANTDIVVCPEPGESNRVTTRLKAWSVVQNQMVNLIAETFYRDRGGTESTGSIVLRSGVEAVYSYYGYSIREVGVLNSLPFTNNADAGGIRVFLNATGQCYFIRGGMIDDEDDGYLISILYIEKT